MQVKCMLKLALDSSCSLLLALVKSCMWWCLLSYNLEAEPYQPVNLFSKFAINEAVTGVDMLTWLMDHGDARKGASL